MSLARNAFARAVRCCLLLSLGLAGVVHAQTTFTDVSAAAGIEIDIESYGASLGDYNGDGLLDIFVSNHREQPSLFLNRGDGTYTDVAPDISTTWVNRATADTHGGTFADYDNDGDRDIQVSLGTGNPNQFLVNDHGRLDDQTEALGVGDDALGGRMPIWLDWNDDGRLDFVVTQFGGAARLYTQNPAGDFTDDTTTVGLLCLRFQYGQLFDVNDDQRLEVVCPDDAVFPQKIYDTFSPPWLDLTTSFPAIPQVADTILADFDGDLRVDMFALSNVQLRPSSVKLANSTTIEANLINGEKGFNFISTGPVTFDLDWNLLDNGLGLPRIRIGDIEFNPFSVPFTLDPADPNTVGLPDSDPGSAPIMRIGYDPVTERWTVIGQTENIFSSAYYTVTTTGAISDLNSTGLVPSDQGGIPTLISNTAGGYVDTTVTAGLGALVECASVTAGDFDNDMDVDLYLACRTGAENLENIYYDNQGNGTFVAVTGAGGAAGPVGANITDNAGTADSVVAGDLDGDGFLDLFVTNGLGLRPVNFGGPMKLYQNQGNTNHWIQLDLAATTGVREPVGARVTATAGGVSQLRVYDGAYHRWSQDAQRLHFGLGTNTLVDLTIEWPDGTMDTYLGVAADTIYRVEQGSAPTAITLGSGQPFACGAPVFDPATEAGAFVWRDCLTDAWRMRFSSGGPFLRFEGTVTADQPFASSSAVSVESNDIFDNTTDPQSIIYSLGMINAGIDGFNVVLNPGTTACMDVDLPAGTSILYGPFKTPVGNSIDLMTGMACTLTATELSVADVTVAEDGPTADFTLTLAPASAQVVTVDVATVDGTALAGSDYTALGTATVTFQPGETSATVSVPIIDDALGESAETFELQLSNPSGATLTTLSATATITDNEVSGCGEPAFDAGTEAGVFVWQDCTTGIWSARFTSGGSPTTVFYTGNVASDQAFGAVSGVSLENTDTVDSTTDPLQIDYDLRMLGTGFDGFDFTPAAGASLCFDRDGGGSIFVGGDKTPFATPIELTTLGSCSALPPTVSAADLTVGEAAPTADVSINLSQAAAGTVSVDVTLVDGTATDGADYTAGTTTTVSFAPGELTQSLSVPLLDDLLAEGDETFTVQLSNPSGVILGNNGTVTITDDETSPCGEPTINAGTEAGIFLWRDCAGTNEWRFRATGGGTFIEYVGDVVSSAAFASVTGFSIEGSDTLDFTTDPLVIDYVLKVSGSGSDGVDFAPANGSATCFDISAPIGTGVFLGVDKTPLSVPFDLETLGACAGLPPEVSVADSSAAEGDGQLSVTVSLSAPSASDVTVTATLSDGSAALDSDLTGSPSQAVTVPAGATSAAVTFDLIQDVLAEGDETLTLTISNPVNGVLGVDTATLTIVDDELSPCGVPTYDAATEAGVFLYKTCSTGEWQMRIAAGGVFSTYSGNITSGAPYASVSGFSVEGSDTLDFTTDPAVIDYALTVSGGGQDGADFALAANQDACFDLTAAPAGATVYVGADRNVLVPPFALNTLGACGALPTLSTADLTVTEGETANIRLILTAPSAAPITVDYTTVDGTANAGADYTAAAGQAVVPAGASTVLIPVATTDDGDIESTEDFTVALSNAAGAILATPQSTVTIIDNDSATLSIDDVTVAETGGQATFTVTLSTPELSAVTVDYATADGTATAGADYTAVGTTTLTFNPGETSKTVPVAVLDDLLIEGDETFSVVLSNAVGAGIATPAGTATITDDETPPVISIANATEVESAASVTLTLTLSTASAQTVTVDASTADGTATAGADYTGTGPATITFPAGVQSASFVVPLLDDSTAEGDETFAVNLTNPVGATLGVSSATVTLTDDESAPTLTVADVSASEDAGTITFTATLSAAAAFPVSADWATVDGTAVAPDDYVGATGVVSFASGETTADIVITLTDDLVIESDETFGLDLSNANGVVLGTTQATGTIGDDDSVVCGEPAFDPVTESVVAVWLNCDGSNVWSVRTTAGPSGFRSYPGLIRSNQGFGTITGVSLEPGDSLETSDPSAILFTMGMSAPGFDGIDFEVSPTATVCFNINVPPGSSVVIGADRTPGTGSFDLRTLQPCADLPQISVADLTVTEGVGAIAQVSVTLDASSTDPVTISYETIADTATSDVDYTAVVPAQTLTIPPGQTTATADITILDDPDIELDETFSVRFFDPINADFGIGRIEASAVVTIDDDEIQPAFEVQDLVLDEAAGIVSYDVVLTAPETVTTSIDVETIDGTATGGADYTAIALQTLTFLAGETVQTISLEVLEDPLAEGPESFTVQLSNPVGAPINRASAQIDITDNEPSPCGQPTYDPATERALFAWKDCATGVWEATWTGGTGFVVFEGNITSSASLINVTEVSIESNDVVDNVTDPAVIDYNLRVASGFEDGVRFETAPGSTNCATLTAPGGIPVFVGADRNAVGAAFSLETLGTCP